jgi:hypothetical protein
MKRLAAIFLLLTVLFTQNVLTQQNGEYQNLVPSEITAMSGG